MISFHGLKIGMLFPSMHQTFQNSGGKIESYRTNAHIDPSRRGLNGAVDAFLSTGEAIINIRQLPGAIKKLCTSAEARQAVLDQLEEKLERISEGDAEG